MSAKDVSPINLLSGMAVLSLTTGNKLGHILELFIDPINGVLSGMTLSTPEGRIAGLGQEDIYSFGRDAVMVTSDEAVTYLDNRAFSRGQQASKLIGTKIITQSGDVLGHITNIFVTLKPPPHILYAAGQSLLDKLLGREFFIPASIGHALSDDAARLVVPNDTADIATSDLASLLGEGLQVRSYDPAAEPAPFSGREDDTILVGFDSDETVVRPRDEDETVVRLRDDDETVVRRRAG